MPRSNCQLTVVFPTYRRAHEVETTLSELRRSLSIPYEAIVIDNSPEPQDFSLSQNERRIFAGSNLGSLARNIGNAEAKAPFILQLDDDSHPLPGAVESAIKLLKESPDDVAGVTSQVVKTDGSLENTPLLPTVFHGCGVLFKKSAIDRVGDLYPQDFLFYGEEYWSALLIYSKGFRLAHLDSFRVCHRFSGSNRSKEQILYRLTVNNRRTWPPFAPEDMLESIMNDTSRRYELISEKEGVSEAYKRAMTEPVNLPSNLKRLDHSTFARYSLMDGFDGMLTDGRLKPKIPAILCGCGKFPSLWAARLEKLGIPELHLADLNPGLAGKDYFGRKVLSAEEALAMSRKGVQAIVGHCSVGDARNWEAQLLKASAKSIARIII